MATKTIQEKLEEMSNETITQQYESERLCDKDINVIWSYSQRHTNAFCVSGRNKSDFLMEMKTCCDPHLKKFWQNNIEDWDSKSTKSISQNEENFERLEVIEREACGVGIRRVRHILNNMVRKFHDKESYIIFTLIDLEYANLKAKLHVGEIRSRIYNRKEWLMEKLSWLLKIVDGTMVSLRLQVKMQHIVCMFICLMVNKFHSIRQTGNSTNTSQPLVASGMDSVLVR